MDSGRTIDEYGEAHQGSLRQNRENAGLTNLDRSMLCIILKVHPSDSHKNRLSGHFSDRHAFSAVAEVLVTNDGRSSAFWRIPNVLIPPVGPSGLDNFQEFLPRGSSQFINGEVFVESLTEADINDLDGDWGVINFIGGNVNTPYISNWWPNPRNKYDTQTSGVGHPNSQGVGQALNQQPNGKSRYFKRINGVEWVINDSGDIFLSTHYANSVIAPSTENVPTNGRFPRTFDPSQGGGIRVNVKRTQALELNWNDQEDGIGLNDSHDPTLPQSNPQNTTPIPTGVRNALYIRLQNRSAVFETPALFKVNSQQTIDLTSSGNIAINVGTSLRTTVGGIMETNVTSDITHTTTAGDFTLRASEGDILIEAVESNITHNAGDEYTISAENDIIITSALTQAVITAPVRINLDSATVNVGTTSPSPAIRGTQFVTAQSAVWGLLLDWLVLLAGDPTQAVPATVTAATAARAAITAYLAPTGLPATLSTTAYIGQ